MFGIVIVCCVVFAGSAGVMTRRLNRGRGAVIVLAFFVPALFVAYLLVAGYWRNNFHRSRLEASNIDGECTLPLGNGYSLRFLDKMPSLAMILNEDFTDAKPINVDGVRSIATANSMVFGQTDFFFSLNLSSGQIKRFADEAEMRRGSPPFGALVETSEAFSTAEDWQRGSYFWPLVACGPIAILVGGLIWSRRRRDGKPIEFAKI
jgi:hypothetical protein